MNTPDSTPIVPGAVERAGSVVHVAQYGTCPAFYWFEHFEYGRFDVRGLGIDLPEGWTSLTDPQRLDFATQNFTPVPFEEMCHRALAWERRQNKV